MLLTKSNWSLTLDQKSLGSSPSRTTSQFNPDYNPENCNTQYSKCLNNTSSGITIKSLFHIAKKHGVSFTGSRQKAEESRIKQENSKEYKKASTNKFLQAKEYLEQNYEIRFNIVSTEFEFKAKGVEEEYLPLNENTIYVRMQLDGVNISLNNLVAILKSAEIVPPYNPFFDYFSTLPKWDEQTDHIIHLAGYVKVGEKDRRRFDNHFKKWLVRTVKCALVDGYFNKQAFILVQSYLCQALNSRALESNNMSILVLSLS